jgi:hypothetical protein
MRTKLIVFLAPPPDPVPGIFHRQEPVHIQTLITETPVKRFKRTAFGPSGVMRWFSGSGEVQSYFVFVSPLIQRLRDKLTAIIYLNAFWNALFLLLTDPSRLPHLLLSVTGLRESKGTSG